MCTNAHAQKPTNTTIQDDKCEIDVEAGTSVVNALATASKLACMLDLPALKAPSNFTKVDAQYLHLLVCTHMCHLELTQSFDSTITNRPMGDILNSRTHYIPIYQCTKYQVAGMLDSSTAIDPRLSTYVAIVDAYVHEVRMACHNPVNFQVKLFCEHAQMHTHSRTLEVRKLGLGQVAILPTTWESKWILWVVQRTDRNR